MLYGALEAGGTKMVMAMIDEGGNQLKRQVIPTRTPEETMPEMIQFFRENKAGALGVGCFGPLDLNPASPGYGRILSTPKLSWRNYPILDAFIEALDVPVALDTDVNAAALAEWKLGAAKGLNGCMYVTIGTGIGGGIISNGRILHGTMHPELGHILLQPSPDDPMPEGICPYHQGCLEGLASGPSIERRWKISARDLPPAHPAWELESGYLARLCADAMLFVAPERIILGGGIMHQQFLLDAIRRKTAELLGGYLPDLSWGKNREEYIVPPALGDHSGILGAWLLSRQAG